MYDVKDDTGEYQGRWLSGSVEMRNMLSPKGRAVVSTYYAVDTSHAVSPKVHEAAL